MKEEVRRRVKEEARKLGTWEMVVDKSQLVMVMGMSQLVPGADMSQSVLVIVVDKSR
jgi:hypothetical protein